MTSASGIRPVPQGLLADRTSGWIQKNFINWLRVEGESRDAIFRDERFVDPTLE